MVRVDNRNGRWDFFRYCCRCSIVEGKGAEERLYMLSAITGLDE